jgi:hypothetical protein
MLSFSHSQEDIIAVWTRDASDEVKKTKICEAMRTALDLPKGYRTKNTKLIGFVIFFFFENLMLLK